MKIANVESDVLFPVPFWVIDFDGVENINRAILQEIDRIDWDAEHQRRGLKHLVNSCHQEDVFITTELVPSAKQVVDAFGRSCLEIGRELGWDLEHSEIRVLELWAHITAPGKVTQTHDHAPSHLSCAYYVTTPQDCGELHFKEDRKQRASEPASPNLRQGVAVQPKEGRMVIFPGWLSHYVSENRSGQRRVSLSCNADLMPKALSQAVEISYAGQK